MLELLKVRSAKSVKAVVLDVVGSTRVRVPPPALYPVPLTSLLVVYAVVAAVKLALLVYMASLNVLPPEFLKLWTPSSNSFLKDVHIKLPLNAYHSLLIISAKSFCPASSKAL